MKPKEVTITKNGKDYIVSYKFGTKNNHSSLTILASKNLSRVKIIAKELAKEYNVPVVTENFVKQFLKNRR